MIITHQFDSLVFIRRGLNIIWTRIGGELLTDESEGKVCAAGWMMDMPWAVGFGERMWSWKVGRS